MTTSKAINISFYTAQSRATCPVCNKDYNPGAKLAFDEELVRYGHVECVVPRITKSDAGQEITRSPEALSNSGASVNANPVTHGQLDRHTSTAAPYIGETMQTTNQTEQKEYQGVEGDINALEQEMEAQHKEATKNSRFKQIEDKKTAQLTFTGKVFKRTSTGSDDKGTPYTAKKLDWELTDIIPEGKEAGKHKLFSVGATNSINREILANIKAGRMTMLISRTGTGKATTYKVTTLE